MGVMTLASAPSFQ